jgi:hypothetical protein
MKRNGLLINHPPPLSPLALSLALLVSLLWPVIGADAPTLAVLPAGVAGILAALAARSGSIRLSAIPIYARAAAKGGRYGVATATTGGGAR